MTPARSLNHATDMVLHEIDKIGPCILIGHSFGGLVARRVAGISDDLLGLALICPAPANPFRIPIKTSIKSLKYLWSLITGRKFAPSTDDLKEMFGKVLGLEQASQSFGTLVRQALTPTYIRPARVKQRVLVVTNGDPTCGPKTNKPLLKKDPGYQCLELNHPDHYPMLLHTINGFFDQVLQAVLPQTDD